MNRDVGAAVQLAGISLAQFNSTAFELAIGDILRSAVSSSLFGPADVLSIAASARRRSGGVNVAYTVPTADSAASLVASRLNAATSNGELATMLKQYPSFSSLSGTTELQAAAPSTPPADDDNSSVSTGVIVGIVIGAVLLVLILVFAVWKHLRNNVNAGRVGAVAPAKSGPGSPTYHFNNPTFDNGLDSSA